MAATHPVPAIRTAVDADGPAIAALISGVFAEYDNCPFVPEEFPELAAPAAAFAKRGGRLWVAPAAERAVVGCIAVAPTHRPNEFEIFKLYVAAGLRGGGLAARLLATAMDHAATAGGRRILLWSDTRFLRGHAFYRKHGFLLRPGLRALHDVARSLEFGFCLDLPGGAHA